MRVLTGTSGFSYKAWKGSFYPEDLPDSEMLRFYSSRLQAVEINNTFYRMPRAALLQNWAEQVPDGFAFALKATQQITHRKRPINDTPAAMSAARATSAPSTPQYNTRRCCTAGICSSEKMMTKTKMLSIESDFSSR